MRGLALRTRAGLREDLDPGATAAADTGPATSLPAKQWLNQQIPTYSQTPPRHSVFDSSA
jgi:hypothetical protein